MEGSKENPIKLPEVIITPNLSFDFEGARNVLFSGSYTQLQVDSINALVEQYNELGDGIPAQLAYILSSCYHEGFDYDGKSTGKVQRLVPIKEKGGDKYLKSKTYYPYIGLGLIQITWRANYLKYQPLIKAKFNVDIMEDPELLLRVDIAAYVAVYGMIKGNFTGKKLSDYITKTKKDFRNARRIINSLDKADLIKGYADKFLKFIK